MYALQNKETGQLFDIWPTLKEANDIVDLFPALEIVDIDNSSKLQVVYTELDSPWGIWTSRNIV